MVSNLKLPKKGKFPALERAGFLVPAKVSVNEKMNIERRGTEAFVPIGTAMPKGLSAVKRRDFLRRLAEEAPFFRKIHAARQEIIAEKLEAAGIKTEKLILRNGRAVFEKSGHSLNSDAGKALFRKHFWGNAETLEKMIAKMHSLGISHNHLHGGNITIDEKGTIRIIDLGKATIVDLKKIKRLPKGWIFKKFFSDLGDVSGVLLAMGASEAYPGFRDHAFVNIVGAYSRELIDKIPWEDAKLLISGYSAAKEHMQKR